MAVDDYPEDSTANGFLAALLARMDRTGSALCIGLDPVLERLPGVMRAKHEKPLDACVSFCHSVIDAAGEHAAAVKIQSACFERFGGEALGSICSVASHAAEAGLPVILDAKRGDIGISAEHYAAAAVAQGAGAITVSPYLGSETVEPYLSAGLAVLVLVRTSNPGGDELQAVPAGGTTVAGVVAGSVARLGAEHVGPEGLSAVGAVVGATKSAEAAVLRRLMPHQVFLVPGFGAQGGTAEDLRTMRRADAGPISGSVAGAGVLVTASRSIIYAGDGSPEMVAGAARTAAAEIASALRSGA